MDIGEGLFKDLLDNLQYGVCRVDNEKRILYWNRAAERLTGYSVSDVLGKKFSFCKENFCPVSNSIFDGTKHRSDVNLKKKKGGSVQVHLQVNPSFDSEKRVNGAIVTLMNNSSRLALARKVKDLEQTASYDFLTKIHNRRLIEQEMYKRFDELNRYNKNFGIIFLDVDYFKRVNDNYGHDVGDEVLKMIATKLYAHLRPFDFLGRWGGEEFMAIVTNVDALKLRRIATRFKTAVEQSSIFTGKGVLKVTISIGATLAKDEDNIHTLVKRADELLYKSKSKGRNRVTLDNSIT